MLNTLLVDQGIIKPSRLRLLCIPDYLFFRTHSQKLYREYSGIPRYSIISRKVTDQYDDYGGKEDYISSLKDLFIVDGSTALINAPFYFPLAEQLDMNVVGTRLDITELPKIRYTSIRKQNFRKFEPTALASDEVHYHAVIEGAIQDSKAVSLPVSFNLFNQPIIPITKNTIAVGSVRRIEDFVPTNFDLLRINIGDFIEYNQLFLANVGKSERKTAILDLVSNLVNSFDIKLVMVSLYKIAKYLTVYPKGFEVKSAIKDMCEHWGFEEAFILMNEKRRIWKQHPIDLFDSVFDGHGYIALFNHLKPKKKEKDELQDLESFSSLDDDILDG